MDMTLVRLSAHILLIGWATAIAFLLIVARGRTVKIVHVPIVVAGLGLFALWVVGLVFSMKATGPIPRETIIPILAALELGAGFCGWGWLALSAKYNFRIAINWPRIIANG